MKVSDLRIVVTGAASGMGRHFAASLCREGAGVAALDVDEEGLRSLVGQARGMPGRLSSYRANVADEAEVAEAVRRIADDFDGVNGLINNAGIFRDALLLKRDKQTGELTKMTLQQWQSVIDVDLTGPFLMTREVASQMVERRVRPGVVINVSSVSRHGNIGQSNYSAAKAGLVADTTVWAKELARHGIRVAALAPGFIRTPILDAMRPEMLQKMTHAVPLGRLGEPEDVYRGLKFIVECEYFTGRCLDIDGGLVL